MQAKMKLKNHDRVDYYEAEECPVHDTPHKKTYTFGSTMSAETDVCVFRGCKCAVAIRHDPVGTLEAVATWHTTYNDATGVAKLHAMLAAAKYR